MMVVKVAFLGLLGTLVMVVGGCERGPVPTQRTAATEPVKPPPTPAPSASTQPPVADTCVGPYSSFWDDPSNKPPPGVTAFRLSQAYPKTLPAIDSQPWLVANPFAA